MARVSRILVEKDVIVPLRDGVRTTADLFRPADGPPVPALVTRNPYGKDIELRAVPLVPSPVKLAERGYAVLVADTRGRFGSEGRFTPFADEGRDGYDTVEWTARQPWCDGKVGLYGLSYLGVTTLLAARERPPSLRCAVPMVTADDYFNDWVYRGGAFQLGFAGGWARGVVAADVPRWEPSLRERYLAVAAAVGTAQHVHPLAGLPGVSFPEAAPWWADWMAHPQRDDYWAAMSPARDYADYTVPMLHIGGWWDLFAAGTVRNYRGMRAAGGTSGQHLWLGPWAHTHYDQWFGDLDLGPQAPAAASGVIGAFNRFVDQHLRDAPGKLAPVHYFLLGANQWCDGDDWPPSAAEPKTLYLHSHGAANSSRGDGTLNERRPESSERPDRFLYDPERPVPSSEPAGPRDQRPIEARDDVLCYTTEALDRPLDVVGPVTLRLWAASDAPNTDWTAKLVDVYPDGRAIPLCDGILRASHRHSLAELAPLTPGTPEAYEIFVGDTACRLAAGHRLRVEVSSSSFPKYHPNPNTGRPVATETEARVAIQHVLHDEAHPSALLIHVLRQ